MRIVAIVQPRGTHKRDVGHQDLAARRATKNGAQKHFDLLSIDRCGGHSYRQHKLAGFDRNWATGAAVGHAGAASEAKSPFTKAIAGNAGLVERLCRGDAKGQE
jgi:hypothetical protein